MQPPLLTLFFWCKFSLFLTSHFYIFHNFKYHRKSGRKISKMAFFRRFYGYHFIRDFQNLPPNFRRDTQIDHPLFLTPPPFSRFLMVLRGLFFTKFFPNYKKRVSPWGVYTTFVLFSYFTQTVNFKIILQILVNPLVIMVIQDDFNSFHKYCRFSNFCPNTHIPLKFCYFSRGPFLPLV